MTYLVPVFISDNNAAFHFGLVPVFVTINNCQTREPGMNAIRKPNRDAVYVTSVD